MYRIGRGLDHSLPGRVRRLIFRLVQKRQSEIMNTLSTNILKLIERWQFCVTKLLFPRSDPTLTLSLKTNVLLIFKCVTSNVSQCTKCKCMLDDGCNKQSIVWFCICIGNNPLAKAHVLSSRTCILHTC